MCLNSKVRSKCTKNSSLYIYIIFHKAVNIKCKQAGLAVKNPDLDNDKYKDLIDKIKLGQGKKTNIIMTSSSNTTSKITPSAIPTISTDNNNKQITRKKTSV